MPIDLAMQNLMKTMGEQGIRSFEQMGVTQACDFAATFVDQQARHVGRRDQDDQARRPDRGADVIVVAGKGAPPAARSSPAIRSSSCT